MEKQLFNELGYERGDFPFIWNGYIVEIKEYQMNKFYFYDFYFDLNVSFKCIIEITQK